MPSKVLPIVVVIIFAIGIGLFLTRGEQFEIPRGKTVPLEEIATSNGEEEAQNEATESMDQEEAEDVSPVSNNAPKAAPSGRGTSNRQIFVTDEVKHSIPLDEILSGGPPKDGIPSIDDPQFLTAAQADFLADSDIGLGIVYKGEARFYPYQILVWHEIANDTVQGDPLLVTYCPLCMTGIVFDRRVNDVATEFGVSGKLWQSNLLMYNRTPQESEESLWSQVLGEAVLGFHTGKRLDIIPSDTVRYSDWRGAHPNTLVLSRDTGAVRPYGSNPYSDYFTNDRVSFGATFSDNRLGPKEFVLGAELNGQFKAYVPDDLIVGATVDQFAGETITIEKSAIGEVRMFIGPNRASLPYIGGFWFSWVAVHPGSELFKK